ncbi:mitochondrial 54S ribosomal protein YmL47 [Multifurca ochricompacta]|uniref:Mitochondrial 54S ribosomal protein YmL47 n=1 Tax=Multifurca ochricompacta TaxID=376703 RepID=A0AAD4M7V0_9AGAM|nr:mitochondrial 54S ribosomal protein YmL47 [Multifurca ochricompacta]
MLLLQSVHSLILGLGIARSTLPSALRTQKSTSLKHGFPVTARFRHQLAPRKVTFIKRHKGVIPIPTGGSVKGTTVAYGDWGLRIKGEGARLTAKQLTTAEEVIKRKIKPVKGAKVYLRVFPDIPVCIKGNETRMGKGKGTFEFWATRVPTGRVIFEIGGAPVREELARDGAPPCSSPSSRQQAPNSHGIIDRKTPPRLGSMLLTAETEESSPSPSTSTPS